MMRPIRRIDVVGLIRRLAAERGTLLDIVAQQRVAIHEWREAYQELAAGLDEVRKGLAENRAAYYRVALFDQAANAQRDDGAPLQ